MSIIFKQSSSLLIFLLFALFGISVTMLCQLIAVFFSRAKTASLVGGVAFLVSFFPYYSVANATTPFGTKVGRSG